MSLYLETSALAKRYVLEQTSADFERFLAACDDVLVITPLVVTEFHSVLARRHRMKQITADYRAQAQGCFAADQLDLWTLRAFPQDSFADAAHLIADPRHALATLDALHLASARALDCTGFATADCQLARAATACGLIVHSFA